MTRSDGKWAGDLVPRLKDARKLTVAFGKTRVACAARGESGAHMQIGRRLVTDVSGVRKRRTVRAGPNL